VCSSDLWRKEILKEIDKKGISQRQFCKRTGISPPELSIVINKERGLTIKIALALEFLFIKTADYWLGCQLKEQIKAAKKKDGRF